MEKTLQLKAEIREHTGSKYAARLRMQGWIPAIVYGHKQQPVPVSIERHAFVEGLHHGYRLVDLEIDGKKEKVIVKDLQYDHLGRDIIHADLMRVDVRETVRVEVPIELKGMAKGAQQGGIIIEEHADHIEIECRVADIPEVIVVSVKDLEVGETIHASDIELPKGAKLVSSPDMIIATCHVVAAAPTTEELEEQAPVAPEVISQAKEEEERTKKEQ